MGETANITKLPPFGDLLNSGIQTLKNLSGRSSIRACPQFNLA